MAREAQIKSKRRWRDPLTFRDAALRTVPREFRFLCRRAARQKPARAWRDNAKSQPARRVAEIEMTHLGCRARCRPGSDHIAPAEAGPGRAYGEAAASRRHERLRPAFAPQDRRERCERA